MYLFYIIIIIIASKSLVVGVWAGERAYLF